MAKRIDLEIPEALLADYREGRATVADLAERLRVSPSTLQHKLRERGVDTAFVIRKREKFARQLEAAEHLEPGSAYPTIAELYRQGLTTRQIAKRLHMTNGAVARILMRAGTQLRPVFYRSVFDGHGEENPAFAKRLRELRLARGLTRRQLAQMSGFCQSTIGHLETLRNGPLWTTLYKVCEALEAEPEDLGIDWEPEGEVTSHQAPDASFSMTMTCGSAPPRILASITPPSS